MDLKRWNFSGTSSFEQIFGAACTFDWSLWKATQLEAYHTHVDFDTKMIFADEAWTQPHSCNATNLCKWNKKPNRHDERAELSARSSCRFCFLFHWYQNHWIVDRIAIICVIRLASDFQTGKAQAWPQWHIVFEKDGRPMIEIRAGAHAGRPIFDWDFFLTSNLLKSMQNYLKFRISKFLYFVDNFEFENVGICRCSVCHALLCPGYHSNWSQSGAGVGGQKLAQLETKLFDDKIELTRRCEAVVVPNEHFVQNRIK